MTLLFLDFETRSLLDFRKVGVYAYAHHPSTEITCTGWAVEAAEAVCEPGFPVHVQDLILNPAVTIVAHNAQMEREMIHGALGIQLPWSRFIDTAALAARMALPRGLDAVAAALKLSEQKDMTGHRIMLRLARPHGEDDDEFYEEADRPEDFAALREYCRQDVVVMREVHLRLLPLSPKEKALYDLTGEMNDAGVGVDHASIPPALELLERHMAAGEAEFKTYTNGRGIKSYKKVAEELGLPDVRKPTVRKALRDPSLPPQTRRALELFTVLARSSPAKLRAFQNRSSSDGRVRGTLVYSGAERTQRWSSGGVQLQNFPRGLGEKTDQAFEALSVGALDLLYEDPVGTIAEALRGFLIGPFLVGDFAQIEARTLNWFAGQADIIALFAAKKDVYSHTASRIFGREIDKKSTDPSLPAGTTPRFIGKTVELGAGYGIGPKKLRTQLDEVYDVDLPLAFAERFVAAYRASHPKVVQWWTRLNAAFSHVVHLNKDRVQVDSRIAMGNVVVGGLRYAFIEIPSGRRLYYAEPEMTADGVKYWGRNIYKGGKWDRVHTYGGKLAENIVQAFSRDVMAEAMLRLKAAGYTILFTAHDEIVAVDNGGLLSDYQNVMTVIPVWAKGLPIEVEVFRSHRYRK